MHKLASQLLSVSIEVHQLVVSDTPASLKQQVEIAKYVALKNALADALHGK